MKVYLAATFSRQAELRAYAEECKQDGHEVTARWLAETASDVVSSTSRDYWARFALHDWSDVENSDVFVLFGDDTPRVRKSALVELGIALSQRQTIFAVGGFEESIFHTLPEVRQCTDWAEVRRWLVFLSGQIGRRDSI